MVCREVHRAVVMFDYGVDVACRPGLPEENIPRTGGKYGSHFLRPVQGEFDEEQTRAQARMGEDRSAHFLSDLGGDNVIYVSLAPGKDSIDSRLFSCRLRWILLMN